VHDQDKSDALPPLIQRQVKYQQSIYPNAHHLDRPSALRPHALRGKTSRASRKIDPPWMSRLSRSHPFHLNPHILLYRLHSNPHQLLAMTDQHLQHLLIVLASSHPKLHPVHLRLFKFAASTTLGSHSLILQTKLRLIV
jgi:hypothetical protein